MKKRTEISVIVTIAVLLAVMSNFTSVCAQGQYTATVAIGDIVLAPQTSATLPITITEASKNFSSADINLTYDKTVVQVTAVTEGDFDVLAKNIVDGKVIMSAFDSGGANFEAPAIVAYITLKAIGTPGECSPLILENNNLRGLGGVRQNTGSPFDMTYNNGSVCIIAGVPVYNTTGMVALVGLLALIPVVTLRRRR